MSAQDKETQVFLFKAHSGVKRCVLNVLSTPTLTTTASCLKAFHKINSIRTTATFPMRVHLRTCGATKEYIFTCVCCLMAQKTCDNKS